MKSIDLKGGFLCNNNCRFCLQAEDKRRGNRPFSELKRDLVEARPRCSRIILTGGEITIRDDFLELVSTARRAGYKVIQIQSNGRLFSSIEFCREVVAAGATEFSPAIHGCSIRQHDFLTRSEGSFMETLKGVRNLRSLGQRVLTNTVIVKPNFRDLPAIARLLVKLDVNQFQFSFVHPVGNAFSSFRGTVPRFSVVEPFLHDALDIGTEAGKRATTEAVPYCFMEGYENHISEAGIPDTVIRGGIGQETNSFQRARKEKGKVKFSQCSRCSKESVCEGPWKEYPEVYGEDEFIPIL